MSIKFLLGRKIRSLRKQMKLSQEKFSELVDLNPRQIVRIENGECFPTAENLEKIVEVLKIAPHELFINEEFNSNEYMKNSIIKNLDKLSEKDLQTIYLIINNLL